jgi:hypothetical protein
MLDLDILLALVVEQVELLVQVQLGKLVGLATLPKLGLVEVAADQMLAVQLEPAALEAYRAVEVVAVVQAQLAEPVVQAVQVE